MFCLRLVSLFSMFILRPTGQFALCLCFADFQALPPLNILHLYHLLFLKQSANHWIWDMAFKVSVLKKKFKNNKYDIVAPVLVLYYIWSSACFFIRAKDFDKRIILNWSLKNTYFL